MFTLERERFFFYDSPREGKRPSADFFFLIVTSV